MYPLSVFLPFHNLYFPFFFFGFQYFSALKILPPSHQTDRQSDSGFLGFHAWDPWLGCWDCSRHCIAGRQQAAAGRQAKVARFG